MSALLPGGLPYMRKYKRVTIESVQLRGMTAWRVVGITDGQQVTIAYFPTAKGAKHMKKTLTAHSLTHAPSKSRRREA